MRRGSAFPWWASNSSKPAYATSQVRRWSTRAVILVSFIASLAILVVTVTVRGNDPMAVVRGPWGSVTYAQSVDAVLSQCGRIFVFDPPEEYYGVFDPDEVTKAGNGTLIVPSGPMLIPVYGWMTEEGLDPEALYYDGESVPELPQILRAMYEGTTVIWFLPDISDGTKQELIDFVNSHPDTVMIEWNSKSLSLPGSATREMPENRHFAFSTWGVSQSCLNFNADVAESFIEFTKTNAQVPHPLGEPNAVQLTPEGKLPSIRIGYND